MCRSTFIRTKEPFSEAPFLLPIRRKRWKIRCISSFCKCFGRFPEPEAESSSRQTRGNAKGSGAEKTGHPKVGRKRTAWMLSGSRLFIRSEGVANFSLRIKFLSLYIIFEQPDHHGNPKRGRIRERLDKNIDRQ